MGAKVKTSGVVLPSSVNNGMIKRTGCRLRDGWDGGPLSTLARNQPLLLECHRAESATVLVCFRGLPLGARVS